MNYPIQKFIPPYEPYAIWEGAFTPEECEKIKQQGELLEFSKGRVGNEREDAIIRDSNITWVPHTPDTEWMIEKLSNLISRMNYDKFQLELSIFDGMQYSKYGKDQHYDWHIDTVLKFAHMQPTLMRKLSLSLMLSDLSEYEGGHLILNCAGNVSNAEPFRPKQGDLVVFYSHIPHKVNPVISGERVTMVSWALGGKLK